MTREETFMVSKAVEIAARGHGQQQDWAKQAYVLHPLRVGMSFDDPKLIAVGALHDVLEDTEVSEEYLRGIFPKDIVDAVVALTRLKDELDYFSYVKKLCKNDLARQVKRADLNDNSDPNRKRGGDKWLNEEGWPQLQERYAKALKIIDEYEAATATNTTTDFTCEFCGEEA